MANQEHLDILKQGVAVWNEWREEHLDIISPDLSYANLSNANLSQINLGGVNLREAILWGVNFSMANLQRADLFKSALRGAAFIGTNLRGANLSGANLWEARFWNHGIGSADLTDADLSNTELGGVDFSHVNLSGAYFSGAYLGGVNLNNANLNGTDFTNATLSGTAFGDRNLRVIKGLETIKHTGPSPLSINAIYLSGGDIPEAFMRGTGVPDVFIEYMLSPVKKTIEYYSCFISHSSKDQKFAEQLRTDLQRKNVQCWLASEDMKTGDRIRPRIHEQIWSNDKLLLVLSASSVASEWVEYEVETALAREHKEKRDILFPIRLDNAVKESTAAWAAHIQSTRHITDFTRWKEHDEYQQAFKRLLRDLQAQNEL